MATPNSGAGIVFYGTVASTGVVSAPVDVGLHMMASFQTRLTTGVATVTVDVQVSNVPAVRDNCQHLINLTYSFVGSTGATSAPALSPFIRDDSYGSNDWVTVSTNYMATTAASRMDVVAYVPHRVARVRLTSAGVNVPTTLVYVRNQGWE